MQQSGDGGGHWNVTDQSYRDRYVRLHLGMRNPMQRRHECRAFLEPLMHARSARLSLHVVLKLVGMEVIHHGLDLLAVLAIADQDGVFCINHHGIVHSH